MQAADEATAPVMGFKRVKVMAKISPEKSGTTALIDMFYSIIGSCAIALPQTYPDWPQMNGRCTLASASVQDEGRRDNLMVTNRCRGANGPSGNADRGGVT
jgi:hypothetical protein